MGGNGSASFKKIRDKNNGGGGGSLSSIPKEAQDRLMGAQTAGEFFNKDNLTSLENNIVEYTGGGVFFTPSQTAQVNALIKASPVKDAPLYRVEESTSQWENIKAGDTFDRDIQSYSKSNEFVKENLKGNYDIDYDEPVLIKITGGQKSLNIQGYSSFKEQEESLTSGKFKVSNVSHKDIGNYTKVKVIELKQK